MLLFKKTGQSNDMIDHASLYRMAESQAGFFTAKQAAQAGMARSTLSHHARAGGRYERVARGVYRLLRFPSSPHEHIVSYWLGLDDPDAVISHESALELYDLSDVIADEVHLTVPRSRRWRRQNPGVRLHYASQPVSKVERRSVVGLPVTSVERTIVDYAHDGGQPDQVETAVAQALARGLSTPQRLRTVGGSKRVREIIARAIEQAL